MDADEDFCNGTFEVADQNKSNDDSGAGMGCDFEAGVADWNASERFPGHYYAVWNH